jgi:phage terminase large subunit-like protein
MSSGSPLIEAGKIWLPERAPWLVEYETQIARFPLADNDDLVDSTSQFLNWFGKPKYRRRNSPLFWK